MGDFFHNVSKQVNYLQSKGLNFRSTEIAQNYFLHNSFYHVMNCYGKLLMKDDNSFYENATFDELAYLHIFDKEVKYIFYKALAEIEISCKALISYTFLKQHPNGNAYLNVENYSEDMTLEAAGMSAALADIIKDNKLNDVLKDKPKDNLNNDKTDKTTKEQHQQSDIFVRLFDELSFEQAINFYSCMKDCDQKELLQHYNEQFAQDFDIKTALSVKQILSYLRNLSDFKNRILSGKTILGYQCRENNIYCKRLHSCYNIKSSDKRKDVYNVFITMRVFLSANQFALVNNSLRKRFKQLFRLISSVDPNTVTDTLGFPQHWHQLQSLPQPDNSLVKVDTEFISKAVCEHMKKSNENNSCKAVSKNKKKKVNINKGKSASVED